LGIRERGGELSDDKKKEGQDSTQRPFVSSLSHAILRRDTALPEEEAWEWEHRYDGEVRKSKEPCEAAWLEQLRNPSQNTEKEALMEEHQAEMKALEAEMMGMEVEMRAVQESATDSISDLGLRLSLSEEGSISLASARDRMENRLTELEQVRRIEANQTETGHLRRANRDLSDAQESMIGMKAELKAVKKALTPKNSPGLTPQSVKLSDVLDGMEKEPPIPSGTAPEMTIRISEGELLPAAGVYEGRKLGEAMIEVYIKEAGKEGIEALLPVKGLEPRVKWSDIADEGQPLPSLRSRELRFRDVNFGLECEGLYLCVGLTWEEYPNWEDGPHPESPEDYQMRIPLAEAFAKGSVGIILKVGHTNICSLMVEPHIPTSSEAAASILRSKAEAQVEAKAAALQSQVRRLETELQVQRGGSSQAGSSWGSPSQAGSSWGSPRSTRTTKSTRSPGSPSANQKGRQLQSSTAPLDSRTPTSNSSHNSPSIGPAPAPPPWDHVTAATEVNGVNAATEGSGDVQDEVVLSPGSRQELVQKTEETQREIVGLRQQLAEAEGGG